MHWPKEKVVWQLKKQKNKKETFFYRLNVFCRRKREEL